MRVPSIPYPPELADAFREYYEAEDRMAKTVDPDGKVTEWETVAEWPAENGGTYSVSKPIQQDTKAINEPPATQTRMIGWTGHQITVEELRKWLDPLPNKAWVIVRNNYEGEERAITVTWEVP